ncbi:MAG: glycosyltransferase family 4 protein [Myxococcales bacterium]|nr:glycosyltransferase family 4 protein [Myxococcales bacterium]
MEIPPPADLYPMLEATKVAHHEQGRDIVNIGMIIGRIGDVDGVALEAEKWIQVLERLGHQVFILSGRFKGHPVPLERETHLPILSFFSPECEWEQNRAFFFPPDDPDELLTTVESNGHNIATEIFAWALRNKIDVLLSENASALPCHLSMGLGIKLAVDSMDIPVVTHDHDYAWERGSRYDSPFQEITSLVHDTFPLRSDPQIRHAVINSAAQQELKQRFDINAHVVPNVMDFKRPFGVTDEYNRDLLKEIGFDHNDIPVFQITRIVERKGIEVAIDLIGQLDDPRIKLVITGSAADDERKGYFKRLVDQIAQQGLGDRVRFAYHRILSDRDRLPDGRKIYSLSDAYASSLACTYFSTYEGFGNAFIETILAKRPVFVNNYKPVFWPDIGSKGFKCVMLENNQLTDEVLEEVDEILHNPELRKEITEHNFRLGREHFSYEVLQDKLEELFSF